MRTKTIVLCDLLACLTICAMIFLIIVNVDYLLPAKIIITLLFAALAYNNRRSEYHLSLYYIIAAIVFNPIYFFDLGKGSWNSIDELACVLLSMMIMGYGIEFLTIAKTKGNNGK